MIIAVGAALALVSGLSAAQFLGLNSNQDHLVSPEIPFHKRYLQNLENFGDQEYLFVVIETDGTDEGRTRAARFAKHLARRLRNHPDKIRAIYYQISPRELGDGALLFASMDQVRQIAEAVVSLAPSASAWAADPTLSNLLDQMAELFDGGAGSLGLADPALFAESMRAFEAFLASVASVLQGSTTNPSPLELGDLGTEYFFTRNGLLLIMRILPHKDYASLDVVGKALSVVRDNLDSTRREFPGIRAGLTDG